MRLSNHATDGSAARGPTLSWIAVALAAGAAALAGGCDDHLMGASGPILTNCQRDPPLTYENTGEGLLRRNCLSCHSVYTREAQRGGAPLDVNFDDWDDVLQWADRIVARAVETDGMPPAATMRADERALLGEWMRCEVLPAIGQFDAGDEPPEEEAP